MIDLEFLGLSTSLFLIRLLASEKDTFFSLALFTKVMTLEYLPVNYDNLSS